MQQRVLPGASTFNDAYFLKTYCSSTSIVIIGLDVKMDLFTLGAAGCYGSTHGPW